MARIRRIRVQAGVLEHGMNGIDAKERGDERTGACLELTAWV
jgi:hypothetical protein